jgi:gamma-tubulin complex component 3
MQHVRQIVQNLVDHFLPETARSGKGGQGALQGQLDRYAAKLECVPSSLDDHSRTSIEKELTEFVRTHGNGADVFAASLAKTRAHFDGYDAVLMYLTKLQQYVGKVTASTAVTSSRSLPGTILRDDLPMAASTASQPRRNGHVAASASSGPVPEPVALALGAFAQSDVSLQPKKAPSESLVPFSDPGGAVDGDASSALEEQRRVMQSVLYACQGQSGAYVIVTAQDYKLTEEGRRGLPRDWQAFTMKFAAIGCKFLRLKSLVGAEANLTRHKQGIMHQAFAAAIMQHELREFFRLLAMLQALVLKPVSSSDASYLTIDRLSAFLQSAHRRIRMLVTLAEHCNKHKGGHIGSVLQAHIQRGQQFEAAYAARLLGHVCVPLYEMIRSWIYQGELQDSYDDFFVTASPQQKHAAGPDVWRASYELKSDLQPSFISPRLARNIMRAGKSINFLREHCDDVAWVQESASAAQFAPLKVHQVDEPERALTEMVHRACLLVDARLKGLILDKFGFMHHCDAIAKLLFFGQGDFATSFLHHTEDLLPLKASQVTPFELASRLKKAMDASNVRFEPDDIQDRLHVRMAGSTGSHTTVADVVRLQYHLGDTLTALLPADAMERCEQISALLWKTKTMEFTLLRAYRMCWRMETLLRQSLRHHIDREHTMWMLLIHAGRLHLGMHNFCQALQSYMSFEVLDGAWHTFTDAVNRAGNVDEVQAAHNAYLTDIHSKALLDADAEGLRDTLSSIFDLSKQLLLPLFECEAHVAGFVSSLQQAELKMARRDEWGSFKTTTGDFAHELERLVATQRRRITRIDSEFLKLVQSLFLHTDSRAKFHIRFAMMRVNFDGFYSKQVAS